MIPRDQIESIRVRCDLLALIEQGMPLRRVSSTHGGEWAGPCPFCGGRDRLRVQPAMRRWWCRQCSPDERWHDCIRYVMRRERLTFRRAVALLTGSSHSGELSERAIEQPATHRRLIAPPAVAHTDSGQFSLSAPGEMAPFVQSGWQADAAALLARAQAELHRNPRALGWLLRARGIRQEMAQAWGLGLLPCDGITPVFWTPYRL
jgi:hypothetical protein